MFAILRPHRIDFSGILDFPSASWEKLLDAIGAARAQGRIPSAQRILFAGDEAFVFVWAATTSELKETLHRYDVITYTEEELKGRSEATRPVWLRNSIKYRRTDQATRHQCHIYNGSPSYGLAKMATATRRKLDQGYRCLYLNSPPMVAGMASYLAATGTDIGRAIADTSLVLSSDRHDHLDGDFDVDRMIAMLEEAILQASRDGFKGLWAAGDMTWEFGSERNFAKLLEYEWRLEELFRLQPAVSGVCQYHASTLPREALRDALASHKSLFINETLSCLNPHYIRPGLEMKVVSAERANLDAVITEIFSFAD
jgi:hypothetical protein